jgi:hypothetical protein
LQPSCGAWPVPGKPPPQPAIINWIGLLTDGHPERVNLGVSELRRARRFVIIRDGFSGGDGPQPGREPVARH